MSTIKRILVTLSLALLTVFTSAQTVELTFTYWGSPFEKEAVERMIQSFNDSHENIQVRGQHIPDAYFEKISTMVAGGTQPDVGYLGEVNALQWAQEGVLLDLTSYFKSDPEASSRLPATYYNYDGEKTIGTNTAAETIIMYYNKDLFDAAGVSYPPSKASEAWTWDEFDTYGISFPTWWGGYTPLIYSNGGKLVSDDGTEFMMNSPEAVEVLQKMQDLIYVHHVAPTPAQAEALPSADIMMQSGKVAMSIDGHWKVLDYSQLGFNWGMGVLPYFKEPTTIVLGSPTVIFAGTQHPDEAFEFYKFHNDPTQVDLYAKGLWMPLQLSYYTDPAKTAEWLDAIEGVYPPEARDVLIDYTLNNTPIQPVQYWLKNSAQIFSEAIDPAIGALWSNEMTAQEAMDQAAAAAKDLLQGRW